MSNRDRVGGEGHVLRRRPGGKRGETMDQRGQLREKKRE